MEIRIGGSRRRRPRPRKSVVGPFLFGSLVFSGALALLWWNEGNAVAQFRTIDDLEAATAAVNNDTVDPALDGQVVYLSAGADTQEQLEDDVFDVRHVALRLRRVAEMYQWQQTTEHSQGRRSYDYDLVWSERHIDSNRFEYSGRDNPKTMPYKTKDWVPDLVTFGAARRLPEFLIKDLEEFEPLNVAEAEPKIEGLKRTEEGFYLGENPEAWKLGDMRLRFEVVRPQVVSLIAAQDGPSFERWESPRSGRKIHRIVHGETGEREIIAQLVTEERKRLWLTRLGGFVLMFLGLLSLSTPITWLGRWVPVLGKLFQSGVMLITLLLSVVMTLAVIMVAWITHRPLYGASLLMAILMLTQLIVKRVRDGSNEVPPATADDEATEPPPLGDEE